MVTTLTILCPHARTSFQQERETTTKAVAGEGDQASVMPRVPVANKLYERCAQWTIKGTDQNSRLLKELSATM